MNHDDRKNAGERMRAEELARGTGSVEKVIVNN